MWNVHFMSKMRHNLLASFMFKQKQTYIKEASPFWETSETLEQTAQFDRGKLKLLFNAGAYVGADVAVIVSEAEFICLLGSGKPQFTF